MLIVEDFFSFRVANATHGYEALRPCLKLIRKCECGG